jgi:hypothetical protein
MEVSVPFYKDVLGLEIIFGGEGSPDDDFDHPRVLERHPIRPHVLYRMNRASWERAERVRGEK